MKNSIKVPNIHINFMLTMDKVSVNKFRMEFAGIIRQIKADTEEIEGLTINFLKNVINNKNSFGKFGGGNHKKPMRGGAFGAAIDLAIYSVAGLVDSAKSLSNDFEDIVRSLSDLSNNAMRLNTSLEEQMQLKLFAGYKGVKYEDISQIIEKTNRLSAVARKKNISDEGVEIYKNLIDEDDINYSSIEKFELILKRLAEVKKEEGINIARDLAVKMFPEFGYNNTIIDVLLDGNSDLASARSKETAFNGRENETLTKTKDGRQIIADSQFNAENNKYTSFLNNYDRQAKNYKNISEIDETSNKINNRIKTYSADIVDKIWQGYKFSGLTIQVLSEFFNNLLNTINNKKLNDAMDKTIGKIEGFGKATEEANKNLKGIGSSLNGGEKSKNLLGMSNNINNLTD